MNFILLDYSLLVLFSRELILFCCELAVFCRELQNLLYHELTLFSFILQLHFFWLSVEICFAVTFYFAVAIVGSAVFVSCKLSSRRNKNFINYHNLFEVLFLVQSSLLLGNVESYRCSKTILECDFSRSLRNQSSTHESVI